MSIDARRVLIVDGFLHDEAIRPWPDGVQRLQTPADAGWIERSLHWPSGGGTERFVALNAAFASDPLLLDVTRPWAGPLLHIACVSTGDATAAHPRIGLRLAPGARLQLVLEHASDGQFERWVNCFVDADVAEGASLELYRLQRHGARTFHTERIDAGSRVTGE